MSIETKVIKIMKNEFNCQMPISSSSTIGEDLGLDSLDSIEMAMSVEEMFDISITEQELESIITVKDLVDIIKTVKARS